MSKYISSNSSHHKLHEWLFQVLFLFIEIACTLARGSLALYVGILFDLLFFCFQNCFFSEFLHCRYWATVLAWSHVQIAFAESTIWRKKRFWLVFFGEEVIWDAAFFSYLIHALFAIAARTEIASFGNQAIFHCGKQNVSTGLWVVK